MKASSFGSPLWNFVDRVRWYRQDKKIEIYHIDRIRYRRHVFVNPSFSEDLARTVIDIWDDLRRRPSFQRELDNIGHLHKRHVLIDCEIEVEDNTFLPKYYVFKTYKQKGQSTLYFSEARRNYSTLRFLAAKGVPVARPLAMADIYACGIIRSSVLFTEKIQGRLRSYKDFVSSLPEHPGSVRRRFFSSLGKELGFLHRLEVHTEDTDKNTVVQTSGDLVRFYFFDFDNVFPWRTPTFDRTVHCLSHFLDAVPNLSEDEVFVFVDEYLKERRKWTWRPRLVEVINSSRRHWGQAA